MLDDEHCSAPHIEPLHDTLDKHWMPCGARPMADGIAPALGKARETLAGRQSLRRVGVTTRNKLHNFSMSMATR
jgi:hypothetical protein